MEADSVVNPVKQVPVDSCPLPLSLALRLSSINGNMKFVAAVLLLAFVAYVSADCGELARVQVKRQWLEAFGHGHNRLEFGLRLWNSFFSHHPEARELFKRVRGDNTYSAEFEAHAQRVLSGVDRTISLLDDQEAFNAEVHHLKGQHAERNLKAEHFDDFRTHLIETLAHYLGTHLDFDAWRGCYDYIASEIKP